MNMLFDANANTVIRDGVVVKEGTKKLFVSIVRAGVSKDFEDYPSGGDNLPVVKMAQKLAAELGIRCYIDPQVMPVGEPLVCLACGRGLFAGQCPQVLAFGSHDAGASDK